MAQDIYAGFCRDCFNKRDGLRVLEDTNLCQGWPLDRELCPECYEAREREQRDGAPLRPLGIPRDVPNTVWLDIKPPVTLIHRNGSSPHNPAIITKMKIRLPKTRADVSHHTLAEVRMCIGDDPHWVGVGAIDLTIPKLLANPAGYARSSVRMHLERLFGPDWRIMDDGS